MKPKYFNWLALGAIVSLIVAGAVHASYNRWSPEELSGRKLLPTLSEQADEIGQITLQQGDKVITLNRSQEEKGWAIAERQAYPADAAKVRNLVLSLTRAELVEPKTRVESRYGLLELEDPKGKDAKSRLVRLSDHENRTIAEIVVGKRRFAAFGSGKSANYLRLQGDPQTWLASLEINASMDVQDWVDPVFFRIDDKQIKSLTLFEAGKQVAKLVPDAKKEGEFTFTEVPEGKKVKQDVRVSELITGLRTLELSEVRKATAADAKPDMTAEIEMKDGARYQIGLKREDGKPWIMVNVLAAGKDKEAAEAIAKGTKGWAYQIADWRSKQTFKPLADLYDEAPKLEPAAATAPGSEAQGEKPAAAAPGNGPAAARGTGGAEQAKEPASPSNAPTTGN